MLLRQPNIDFEEIEHLSDLVTDWDKTEDIPGPWKHMTACCMSQDPNERPDVMEVVRFWGKQWSDQQVGNETI